MAIPGQEQTMGDEASAAKWAELAGLGGGDADDDGAAWAFAGDGEAAAQGDPGRELNQSEIDNLFGVGGGERAAEGDLLAILHRKEVNYERLPMLEVVCDRLERLLTTSMRTFTSENVDINLENITAQRFGDYLNAVPLPAMISVFKAVEWDNFGLITIDSPMILSIVDVLLGSRRSGGPIRMDGRPFTTIEATLVERLIRLVLTDLGQAFQPVTPVHFQFERMETNPRFAAIARPNNACVVFRVRIDLEDRGGTIEFLIPYATLEPARPLLLQQFMGEKFGRDSIWESHLSRQIWHTDVELEALIEERTMSLRELFGLQVGSVLRLNARPDTPVTLRCGTVPMLLGRVARQGERMVIEVEDRIERKLEA